MILEHLQGQSLDWGAATLSEPVTSSTGVVYAVFRIPDGVALTDKGAGGGAGVGIRQGAMETSSYLSADGQDWIGLAGGYHMAVDPVLVQSKGAVPTLASLRPERSEEPQPSPIVYRTELLPPVPNPFNPRTVVAFTLAEPTNVKLMVYNLRGQRVRTLAAQSLSSGRHEFVWRGQDDLGKSVSSGVYFVRMVTPEKQFAQRLALLR